MQIMHCLIKYALICMWIHWIKPGWKFLFHVADILELKVLSEEILDLSFLSLFLLHKSENTFKSLTNLIHFTMFLGIKCYINQANDILTNPSVETYILYKLESLMYVNATDFWLSF